MNYCRIYPGQAGDFLIFDTVRIRQLSDRGAAVGIAAHRNKLLDGGFAVQVDALGCDELISAHLTGASQTMMPVVEIPVGVLTLIVGMCLDELGDALVFWHIVKILSVRASIALRRVSP